MRLQRPNHMIKAGALVAMVVLGGCGSSSDNTTASQASASSTASSTSTSASATDSASKPSAIFKATVPALQLEAGTKEAKLMPARYTCHGEDTWPAINWGTVEADTKEIAVFVIHEGPKRTPVDWAVLGLKPTLTSLAAGKLPAGAIVGRNSKGQARYTVCPPKSHAREYVVVIFALRRHLAAKAGFNGPAMLARVEKKPKYATVLFF